MTETQVAISSRTRKGPRGKQLRFIIGGAIVAATVIYLVFSAARGSAAYYLTVEELLARGASARNVRVTGDIVEGSIVWKDRELVLEFQIADKSGALPVVYHGPRPDMFRDGAQVVIEGQYTAEGIFQAKTLMLKCPSKYEEAVKNG